MRKWNLAKKNKKLKYTIIKKLIKKIKKPQILTSRFKVQIKNILTKIQINIYRFLI